MTSAPYIQKDGDRVLILGDAKNLAALGNMLIMKAKLGSDMSAVLRDDVNPQTIEVVSQDDLMLPDGTLRHPLNHR